MSPGLKKTGLVILGLTGLVAIASAGLGLILRYRPPPLMRPLRRLFGHVLNPLVLWYSNRFGNTSQALVYHRGRKSVREYVTPLCMVSTPEGFIVPAAFGSNVDWLANLRATPDSKVVYEGSTYETTAEVIDLDQAIDYAGGTPGCDCWTQYNVGELVLLRPVASQTAGTS
jgi:deazaflavin-dependent oxidoreductase (nitroreductase family)